jgi:prephenate dehydrogenase
MNRKVTVVGGAGNVGATVARSIAEKELADVVIVDIADQKAAGVALDILETCPIIGSDSLVIGGSDYAQSANSDVVVITSGVPRKPGMMIAWRSTAGARNAGTVRFEPVTHDRTRVSLIMEYEPEGAVEKTGDAIGVFSARVQNTVEDFKEFIEKRVRETGAWRGEVHGGQKKPAPGKK